MADVPGLAEIEAFGGLMDQASRIWCAFIHLRDRAGPFIVAPPHHRRYQRAQGCRRALLAWSAFGGIGPESGAQGEKEDESQAIAAAAVRGRRSQCHTGR